MPRIVLELYQRGSSKFNYYQLVSAYINSLIIAYSLLITLLIMIKNNQ